MSQDPIPADVNPYRYCGNGPTNGIDPSGTQPPPYHPGNPNPDGLPALDAMVDERWRRRFWGTVLMKDMQADYDAAWQLKERGFVYVPANMGAGIGFSSGYWVRGDRLSVAELARLRALYRRLLTPTPPPKPQTNPDRIYPSIPGLEGDDQERFQHDHDLWADNGGKGPAPNPYDYRPWDYNIPSGSWHGRNQLIRTSQIRNCEVPITIPDSEFIP